MSDVQRFDYAGTGLEDSVPQAPWELVSRWVREAQEAADERADVYEPSAMAVATVDRTGLPDVRTVLLRFLDPRGPGFVTSRHSQKAAQISDTHLIAATLTWAPLFRAIRFRGVAQQIESDITDEYWGGRPWGSRISAWASRQSHPVASRQVMEDTVRDLAQRYPDMGNPDDVPVPPDWVGYRIHPQEVEFWAGRPDRLHDRIRYAAASPADLDDAAAWSTTRLQP
ncbi:pyridoxamine 5'-phosphate oxidase [Kineosphaera limosa]|uniref:Pyridoxamine 5'-phosphate oxidase n=1 Tax=Kineosphaera limosa NBRC 100340 TaxID=1184609 RepID=K6WVM2_9MICO|nr:pyridoxamine 5'-phosphate oxidase [Kineosphaera limosa]NYD99622.1 pyridoxamine 5'-phosphate oxidase [Kineosphaera limosa]GAB97861.1 pyridoxine/pyridoxamine 5'-phosphate oxidase [Kineosphaera limosa NBRC 100340]